MPYLPEEPWQRLPRESAKAFAAFRAYRDTPAKDRSVVKCCTAYYGNASLAKVRQWKTWSAGFQWVERAPAWDGEQDRVAREAQLKAVSDMRERHAKQAMMLQQKAIKRLGEMEPDELSPQLLLQYLIEAVKIERLSRGEPDSITQTTGTTRSTQTVVNVPTPVLDEKAGETDVRRIAAIVNILAEAGAIPAGTSAPADAEVDGVYPPPTDAEAGGVSPPAAP